MTPSMVAWRQKRHLNTRRRVGRFYNELAARIINGQTNGHVHDSTRTEFADAWNPGAGVCLESKASSGGHNWRFSISQMEAYNDARPLISYAYCLSSYLTRTRVKKGEKKMRGRTSQAYSQLARIERIADQFAFLARQTDEVYLFDILFFQELEKRGIGRVSDGSFGSREGARTFELRRSDIRPFREPSAELLRQLEFSPAEWIFRKFEMEMRFTITLEGPSFLSEMGYQGHSSEVSVSASFPLYTALSHELDRKLAPIIESSNCAELPF
jgi:hypothetical protein